MYIDTHCHLYNEYYSDIEEVINESKKENVNIVIINGCNMESNKEALELANKYESVYAAIGFHPTELENFREEYFSWLEDNINNKKVVAIGEIGLDYHYDNTDKENQKRIFKRQLDIAARNNKPIIVHSRDAIQDTYDILKQYTLKGSIHSFSGSLEMANKFIKLGYLLGIGGVVTFKNAKNIKEVIKNIDLSYILLETDSPYLTPEPYRGTVNSPKYIPLIAKAISGIKQVDEKEVVDTTTNNAMQIFDFSLK